LNYKYTQIMQKINHGCSQNRTHERIGEERDRFVVEGFKN
jgi:hypothetical protein